MKEVEKNQELNEDELKDVNGGLAGFDGRTQEKFKQNDEKNKKLF